MIGREPAAEVLGVGGRIAGELDALLAQSFLAWALLATLVLLTAWAAGRGVTLLARLAHGLWVDANHRIDRIAAGAHLLFAIIAAVVIVRPLFVVAPLVIGVTVLVLFWILAHAAPGVIEDLLSGLSMLRRTSFREGATVALGETRGVVVEIGLWWTRLRAHDGSAVLVPNRVFSRAEIVVGAAADTTKVQLDLDLPRELTPTLLEDMRRALLVSPFRLPGGAVAATAAGDRRVRVELETWARLETDVVRQRVEATLRALARPAEPRGGDDA